MTEMLEELPLLVGETLVAFEESAPVVDTGVEAEVLKVTSPLVDATVLAFEERGPAVDESSPVLPVTDSGIQERPKQMDPFVV